MNNNTKIIGVGGFARSGKDTFVKIASSILNRNGYNTKKFAFADGLKIDLDPWLKDIYGISAWTSNEDEKKLIRPFMVAHGCGKRIQTEGKYWVDMVERQIRDYINTVDAEKTVCFVSDVRFSNEANWLHDKNGWLVHLKKYTVEKDTEFKFNYEDHPELDGVEHPEQYVDDYIEAEFTFKKYDAAPNPSEKLPQRKLQKKNGMICRLKLPAQKYILRI